MMNIMNKLITKLLITLFIIFQTSVVLSANKDQSYVIGFGSCITEKREQPIWVTIEKEDIDEFFFMGDNVYGCLLYTSPSPRDRQKSRMPSSA